MSENDAATPLQNKMEARLKELDAQIQLYSARAEHMQADARMKGQSALDQIRKYRDAASEELKKYRNATGAALDSVGTGLKKAVDNLSLAVDDAAKTFSEEKEHGSSTTT